MIQKRAHRVACRRVAAPELRNEPGTELDGKIEGAAAVRVFEAGRSIATHPREERKTHAFALGLLPGSI